jgi:multidrug resistance efflux pump
VIVFLTLCYCAVLFALVKLGVIRLNTFWKISPVLWILLLFVVLFLPMQWGAPSGPVQVYQFVVEITPNVSGEVIEVPARQLERMSEGEVLFKIDRVPFQATVDDMEARLALSRTRLEQSRTLARRSAGTVYDVERYEAEVAQLEAQLENARYNLDSTVVRAPADGYVIGLTLRPGQRVSNLPTRGWMSYVVTTERVLAYVNQNQLRHVRPGQSAEVVMKVLPGRILPAKVVDIAPMMGQGQLSPSGTAPVTPVAGALAVPRYGVLLELEEGALPEEHRALPGGAVGSAAIYTDSVKATHVIRRIMMRMQAWIDYVNPY